MFILALIPGRVVGEFGGLGDGASLLVQCQSPPWPKQPAGILFAVLATWRDSGFGRAGRSIKGGFRWRRSFPGSYGASGSMYFELEQSAASTHGSGVRDASA